MHIDELFNQVKVADSDTTLSFPANWCQGRTAFGGLSASMLYVAIRQRVSSDRVLRALNTSFIGPLLAETPFSIEVEVLREGKNTSVVQAKAIQNGEVCVLTQASLGTSRESEINVASNTRHQMQAPNPKASIKYVENMMPAFFQHVDLNVSKGSMPFSGSESSELSGWMRFASAPDVFTDAHLIALADAWPPCVLQMAKKPAPASTLTWNLEFIHPHSEITADNWIAYEAKTRQAAGGYAHTEANLWDEQGELIAISRQCVTVFA
ncbi:acyl-CoA thioesterase [Flocculibacter collagenilyticus]|uniref:acyl-CoA thioesterase n=1 Tax=Flocculibacter collagenilyticus TaxID=2744479 RepID=UPI0018F3448E|nr:thioesterase family protein [Flocculibacter collagenilyticus]